MDRLSLKSLDCETGPITLPLGKVMGVDFASFGILAAARSGGLGIPHPQLIAGGRSKQEDQLQL